jgi:hypothetical protein
MAAANIQERWWAYFYISGGICGRSEICAFLKMCSGMNFKWPP